MSKGRIVFFDATEVRREKMRNAAMGVKAPKAVNPDVEFVDKNVTPPIVEPAPKPEVKVEQPEVEVEQPTPAAPAPAIAVSKEELESALVAFVVEQTGYPEEMVEMDADLEGDLGIDSIKKAQLMGELNEKYHFVDVSAPADNDMSLDDFPTLGSIRDYLLGKAGESQLAMSNEQLANDANAAPITTPEPEPAPAPSPVPKTSGVAPTVSKEELESALVSFVVEQTGYPEEMVVMDAGLEGDLGIDSIKKAQLMGELNEKYHFVDVSAPADNDMSLDDFPTLASIRDYLLGKAGESQLAMSNEQLAIDANAAPVTTPTPEPEPAPAPKSSGAASTVSVSKEELEAALVSFVVEQTGYPEEMVEMDADLEGDLGIDSIKKAQLMGELNEKYHFVDVSAPADNDMSLDDFPTLGSIRDYLLGKAGEAGLKGGNETTGGSEAALHESEPQEEPALAPSSKASVQSPNFKDELAAFLINFVVEQTGYPEDMVEMDVDLEGELGIDSIKKAQLFGELSEKYELVPLGDMSLDDFKTLRDIYNAILQCAR